MPREFYHDAITERSWATLQALQQRYRFVLIGGWAAWLYGRQAKSRDIDLIVDFDELPRLRQDMELRRNDRLRKYEVKADGFDIDIYVPHYSTTLAIAPERVMERTQLREGFRVPDVEILLALKLGAWADRRGSLKGEKDLVDIGALLPLTDRERFGAALPEERRESLLRLYDEAATTIRRHRYQRPRRSERGPDGRER